MAVVFNLMCQKIAEKVESEWLSVSVMIAAAAIVKGSPKAHSCRDRLQSHNPYNK